MCDERENSAEPLAEEDEVIGGAAVATKTGHERLKARWRRWAWSPTGPDTPLPWRTCLYTALAVLAVHVPLTIIGRLQAARAFADNYPNGYPLLSRMLLSFADSAWRGLIYGLALVLADRWTGRWRRTLRWAVALGLVSALVYLVVHEPSSWRGLLLNLRQAAPPTALHLPRPGLSWHSASAVLALSRPRRSWLFAIEGVAGWAFFAYWLARAIRPDGTPARSMDWVGFEGRLIAVLASVPVEFVVTLGMRFSPQVGLAMRVLGAGLNVALPCLEGACLGFALGRVLPRPVPEPAPEADPEGPSA